MLLDSVSGFNNGLWSGLKHLLGQGLEGLFNLTNLLGIPSYALAIILFVIIVKILLYPLTVKQMKSMRSMQQVQPLMKEIEQRYATNPQRKQEETMKLYQQYNINPMGGCLPMLVQMPILIALFQVLREFVPAAPEYYSFFWITDLSNPDPTGLVIPIIAGLATFAQQYLSITNKADTSQKMMLYTMPIVFGWMTRTFPAGLGIYWIGFSAVGAIQQLFINHSAKKYEQKLEQEMQEKEAAKLQAKQDEIEYRRKLKEEARGNSLSTDMQKKATVNTSRRKLKRK